MRPLRKSTREVAVISLKPVDRLPTVLRRRQILRFKLALALVSSRRSIGTLRGSTTPTFAHAFQTVSRGNRWLNLSLLILIETLTDWANHSRVWRSKPSLILGLALKSLDGLTGGSTKSLENSKFGCQARARQRKRIPPGRMTRTATTPSTATPTVCSEAIISARDAGQTSEEIGSKI